ncbi:MAG: hypothetical protein OEV44_08845 [Spirochaetota bacterium]|nr:hypothetical protein [Spirochaetota bacterium]
MIKNFQDFAFNVPHENFKSNQTTTKTQSQTDTTKEIIYNDPFLNKNDRKILFYLINIVEKQYFNLGLNYARVMQTTIAKKQNLSIDQVKRSISKLKTQRYVNIKKINKINLYYINFNKFTLDPPLNHTSTAPESHVKTSYNTVQKRSLASPNNNYNSSSNSNKQLQQTNENVVVSKDLKEKAHKLKLSVTQIEYFLNENYPKELITKCIDYLIWYSKHQRTKIDNPTGYFANILIKAHKNEWDFTGYNNYIEKETKNKTFQNELSQKEKEKEIKENEVYNDLEKKWKALSKAEKEKLINKAKREFPNMSSFIHESLAKSWISKINERGFL